MIALYLVSGCASPAYGLLAMRLTARHPLAYHNAPVPVARFHHSPEYTMAHDELPLVFDHADLSVGLPEDVYVCWLRARADLHESLVQGELRFQFCCGYVQASKRCADLG